MNKSTLMDILGVFLAFVGVLSSINSDIKYYIVAWVGALLAILWSIKYTIEEREAKQ